jgi:hypothetical protein
MENEALEILNMVKEGKITPEQGSELLEALKAQPAAPLASGGSRPRFVRVRLNVREEEKDKVNINVNLPLGLADLALKVANGLKIQSHGETVEVGDYLKNMSGMDIASVLQLVKDGAQGKLVDMDVNDGSDQVKIEVMVD